MKFLGGYDSFALMSSECKAKALQKAVVDNNREIVKA